MQAFNTEMLTSSERPFQLAPTMDKILHTVTATLVCAIVKEFLRMKSRGWPANTGSMTCAGTYSDSHLPRSAQ